MPSFYYPKPTFFLNILDTDEFELSRGVSWREQGSGNECHGEMLVL